MSASQPEVEFSFGYGGSNKQDIAFYQEYINNLNVHDGKPRLIVEKNLFKRLDFCIKSEKKWTLFVADDDTLSEHYIEKFLVASISAGPFVNVITPGKYKMTSAGRPVTEHATVTIENIDPALRYASLLKSKLPGLAFYAMHRSSNVRDWMQLLNEKKYFPSYSDQLLVTLDLIKGSSIRLLDDCFIVRDQSNWDSAEGGFASDAKYYPTSEFLLFHELFWCADMLRLTGGLDEFKQTEDLFCKWSGRMLRRAARSYNKRSKYLNTKQSFIYKKFIFNVWILGQLLRFPKFFATNSKGEAHLLLDRILNASIEIERCLLAKVEEPAP